MKQQLEMGYNNNISNNDVLKNVPGRMNNDDIMALNAGLNEVLDDNQLRTNTIMNNGEGNDNNDNKLLSEQPQINNDIGNTNNYVDDDFNEDDEDIYRTHETNK